MRVEYEIHTVFERIIREVFPTGIIGKYKITYLDDTKLVEFDDFCKDIGIDSAEWKCTVYNKDGIAKIAASADVLGDGDRVIFGG